MPALGKNETLEVEIFTYVTENTFAACLHQLVKPTQKLQPLDTTWYQF